jgi:hypothetical protein
MKRRFHFRANLVVRVFLAAIMMSSLLSSAVPLISAASQHLCTMACCVGKAPHAAKSCTAHFTRRLKIQTVVGCGSLEVVARHQGVLRSAHANAEPKHCHDRGAYFSATPARSIEQSSESGPAVTTVRAPCDPECGCRAANSAGQYRKDNLAASAYAGRPRRPREVPGITRYVSVRVQSVICAQSRPRAPPPSFS